METTQEKINEYLVDVFNQMLDIEESSLAQSQFKDLSIKEMHAIEAIGMYHEHTTTEVANTLNVTVGTLTVAVNVLVKKGYVVRLKEISVTVIGMQKGHTLQENIERNFRQVHPEGFASILWKDSKKAEQASELMKFTSKELMKEGIVDKIILEKNRSLKNSDRTSNFFIGSLKEWRTKSKEELVSQRLEKFRKY